MAHELHDLPPTIGELSPLVIDRADVARKNRDKFLTFSKAASTDAEDYRRMAKEHEERALYFTKCAKDREADAGRYEAQAARQQQFLGAAE